MRSRSNTAGPPTTTPESHPVRSARRTQTRTRVASGRRRRARPSPIPAAEPGFDLLDSSTALYRAEKARRTSSIDAVLMAEAKQLYDAAVAESGKKRAGMRSAVIPPSQRRAARAADGHDDDE